MNKPENTMPIRPGAMASPKQHSKAGTVVKRILLCLLIVLISILILFFSGLAIVSYGPSMFARNLFVTSVMETSAAKFLAHIYFSEEEITTILAGNALVETDEITDETLVEIQAETSAGFDKNKLEIVDVKGSTFKGKMMIINDPSRVYVGTPAAFGTEQGGLRVEEMVKRDGAVAGVNAGGFKDENGVGNGGEPLGLVIKDGVMTNPSGGASTVIGFDTSNKLIVGYMTDAQAMEKNLRDAVSFGPTLIINGEPTAVSGTGGGLNPRTAIGQRGDGTVLILVVDGRQPSSLGATYGDLVDVMLEYGAVNAANLDGGSSSLMVFEDKIITTCASLYGSRKIPTAILVK